MNGMNALILVCSLLSDGCSLALIHDQTSVFLNLMLNLLFLLNCFAKNLTLPDYSNIAQLTDNVNLYFAWAKFKS